MEAEKEKATSFADEIAEVSEKVQSGEMTLNQARIRLGFKPIEGGDEYVILESKADQKNRIVKLLNSSFKDSAEIIAVSYSSDNKPLATKKL